jgi:hypothetical protein
VFGSTAGAQRCRRYCIAAGEGCGVQLHCMCGITADAGFLMFVFVFEQKPGVGC